MPPPLGNTPIRRPSPAARSHGCFGQYNSSIGATRTLPAARRGEPGNAALTGYVVIDAADLDAAATLAAGCPGLAGGVDVEVGEVIPS